MDTLSLLALAPHDPEFRDAPHDGSDLNAKRMSVLRSIAHDEESGHGRAHQFSLVRHLQSRASQRPAEPYERLILERAAGRLQQALDLDRAWVPFGAVATRTMSATPGSTGGYLVGVENMEPADALRPWSVTASAGVQIVTGLKDQVTIPTVKTQPTAGWVAEGVTSSETEPVLGYASTTPRAIIARVKVSSQLLKQGPAVEGLVRSLLMRAVGEAIDRAVFSGAGGAEPAGLLLAPGIGTQSGTSLAHAGVLSMKSQALTAGAQEEALRWVGPPAVQALLGARQRFTGVDRAIWDDGLILGLPAHATKNAPATTLVCGDFRQVVVTIWGPGIRIDIDPSQDFSMAGLVMRAMLFADMVVMQPGAFCVSTSIT